MNLDWTLPYASRRQPILARSVVATSQPLAAQAGLAMLSAGGCAVDAALATAIALTVVEPTNNGIGGDLQALVWDGRRVHALMAAGRSPRGWTRDRFDGLERMPLRGWDSVVVPGAVSGWIELWRRFGRLPLEKIIEPAVTYARDGFLVSPLTAGGWSWAAKAFAGCSDFLATFAPGGRAPRAGERFACPEQARTLRLIARSRGEAFYRGEIATRIARVARDAGAALDADDLAQHRADWVEPLETDFAGCRIVEMPPPTQGVAALMAMGIARSLRLAPASPDAPEWTHAQIEAMKLALADAYEHVGDPAWMRTSTAALLDPTRLGQRALRIDPARARPMPPEALHRGGTVLLTAADRDGLMVTLIQSNFYGFGSGIVIPGTGIALQNRGHGFVLTRGHPNEAGPSKRPFHTIIPALALRGGEGLMSFGVMGGAMQAQGHFQIASRVLLFGQNPQAALDAPRWRVGDEGQTLVEQTMAPESVEALRALGHDVRAAPSNEFGGGQIILRLDGGWCAASDPRKDGQAVGA